MSPYRHHLFVCTGPTCSKDGAEETLQALQHYLMKHALDQRIQVTLCRCLGQCGNGPNMVVYPEGTWYSHVDEKGAAEIVEDHFIGRKIVQHLLHDPVDSI